MIKILESKEAITKIQAVTLGAIVVIAAVAAIAYYYTMQPSLPEVIVVGAINCETGFLSMEGLDSHRGYELARNQINEDPPLGIPMVFVYEDSQSSTEVVLAAIDKAITVDNARFILGPMYSGTVYAGLARLVTYEEPPITILPCGSAPNIESDYLWDFDNNKRINPWAFHMYPWGYDYHRATREFFEHYLVEEQGVIPKAFICHDDNVFGETQAEAMIEVFAEEGWEIVGEEVTPEEFSDYSPVFMKATSLGADIYLDTGTGGAHEILAMKQAKELQYSPRLWHWHSGAFSAAAILEAVPPDQCEYHTSLDFFDRGMVEPYSSDFYDAFVEAYGSAPGYFAAFAYSSAIVLDDAIRRANSIDRDKVLEALENTDLMTPVGRIVFTETDYQGISDVSIFQWQNGEKVFLWPLEIKKASAGFIYPMPPWEER